MKTIGLIGGMSWESTVTYYQVINETIKKQLGVCTLQNVFYTVLILMKSRNIKRGENGIRAQMFCLKPHKHWNGRGQIIL